VWQKPNAIKLLPIKPGNYNKTGIIFKELVPEGTTVTRELYVDVPERILTDFESEVALPSEWQHSGQQPPI